jgi:hypothetical protein
MEKTIKENCALVEGADGSTQQVNGLKVHGVASCVLEFSDAVRNVR